MFATALGASCGGGTDELVIENAWSRATPTMSTSGVVYLDITAPEDDELVGVSVPAEVASEAQLHQTTAEADATGAHDDMDMGDEMEMDDDTETDSDMADAMVMTHVESLALPEGTTVSLEPGGYHIMLMDLTTALEVGESFDLTLDFANAEDEVVVVTVSTAPN